MVDKRYQSVVILLLDQYHKNQQVLLCLVCFFDLREMA